MRGFFVVFLLTSTAATGAVLVTPAGLRDGEALVVGAGALLGVVGLLGVLALARAVFVAEKGARPR